MIEFLVGLHTENWVPLDLINSAGGGNHDFYFVEEPVKSWVVMLSGSILVSYRIFR